MEPKTLSHPEASGSGSGNGNGRKPSGLYQAIMTPIHFVSFLLSLYLIDCHYHDKRIQEHSERYSRLPAWLMPAWLDRLLFRPNPYGWVDRKKQATPNKNGNNNNSSGSNGGGEGESRRWYYHTKQKKLMKMEAADAFEMQRTVILWLCVVVLCALWAVWRLSAGLWVWLAG